MNIKELFQLFAYALSFDEDKVKHEETAREKATFFALTFGLFLTVCAVAVIFFGVPAGELFAK